MYTIFPVQKRGATIHAYLFSLGPRPILVQKGGGGHTTHAYLFSYRTTGGGGGGGGHVPEIPPMASGHQIRKSPSHSQVAISRYQIRKSLQ